ncbi:hypothetical protein L195_g040971, partial [Trifolium pratense]
NLEEDSEMLVSSSDVLVEGPQSMQVIEFGELGLLLN